MHWLKYCAQYRRLVQRGYAVHEKNVDFAAARYLAKLGELKAVADSGDARAQMILRHLPADAKNPTARMPL
jgi:hypothetical protein